MSRRSLLLAWPIALAVLIAPFYDPPLVGRGGFILFAVLVTAVLSLGTVIPWRIVRPVEVATDDRPADGEVPLVGLPGMESSANEARPSIKAFAGFGSAQVSPRVRPSGSRPILRGRIALVSMFVGRDGNSWSSKEIVEAFDSLVRMGRWLEREAARWGAPVNFEAIDTYFAADDEHQETVALEVSADPFRNTIDEADIDLLGLASASRAAARLGFGDLPDLIGRIDALVDHDRTVWFVHLLREGRSRAVAADRYGLPGTGLALCYAREASASSPLVGIPYVDPATLAHELLHLFGASDKYGTPLKTFPAGSVTSRDVMRLDRERLSQLRIDPLTACEIGWTGSPTPRAENRPASSRA